MSADMLDEATELTQHNIDISVAAMRINHNAVSATHCIDCGCEIPKKRREAMPGCDMCIECKTKDDLLKKQRGV